MKWHAAFVVSCLVTAVGSAHPQSLLKDQKAGQETQARGKSAASRQIDAPCRLIEDGAIQFFEEHDFYTIRKTKDDDIVIDLGNRKNASTPSAKPLSLNRSSIRKYTLPRHLSPLRTYDDFRLEGHLTLTKVTEGSCNAALSFDISAYEWVWALAVIDDGYRSKFISNGTLERLYFDSISDLFTKAKR
jgi:hypothetical protein